MARQLSNSCANRRTVKLEIGKNEALAKCSFVYKLWQLLKRLALPMWLFSKVLFIVLARQFDVYHRSVRFRKKKKKKVFHREIDQVEKTISIQWRKLSRLNCCILQEAIIARQCRFAMTWLQPSTVSTT